MSGSPLSAIARIDGAATWGTGFLLRGLQGEPFVLTAGHVADDPPLRVTFTGGFASDAALVVRGQGDWALLRCTDPAAAAALAQIAPIALDELEGPPSTPFDTFGYPRLYGAAGGALHGTVRRVPNGIDLYCKELPPGTMSTEAQGVSGAPCLVADVAVGVIHAVLDSAGMVVADTLQVTLATQIVAESGERLALDSDRALPYLAVVSTPLDNVNAANLASMAEKLQLPLVAGQQTDPLRRRVARGLLVATPEQVARALVSRQEIPALKEAAVMLVVHRESLWLRAATVAAMLEIIDRGGVAALDTTLEITVRHLLRRASWYRGYDERWYNNRHCLMVVPRVDTADAVVEAVIDSARTQLSLDAAKFKLLLDKRKVIAVLHEIVPRPAIATALINAELDKLRVVFMSVPHGADPNAVQPQVRWLLPKLQPDEMAWRDECNSAREVLSNGFGRDIASDEFDLLD